MLRAPSDTRSENVIVMIAEFGQSGGQIKESQEDVEIPMKLKLIMPAVLLRCGNAESRPMTLITEGLSVCPKQDGQNYYGRVWNMYQLDQICCLHCYLAIQA